MLFAGQRRLFAAIAFGDSDTASLWTRLQAAWLTAQLAGAILEAVPEAPRRAVTAAPTHSVMTDSGPIASLAVQRRRESRREEFAEQVRLVGMLQGLLAPGVTFFSSLENRPRSALAGLFQGLRGTRAGLPDELVIFRDPERGFAKPVFVELKSRRGLLSKKQRRVAAELLQTGADFWLARSARAVVMALHLSGVPFRQPWAPPPLADWEGPFSDPHQRLPQEPSVRAERRAAQRRWRERQRACKAATLAAERVNT